MRVLHFYVEEPSMEITLLHLVPKVLEGLSYDFRVFTFQGKPDLLRKLPSRLRAYRDRSLRNTCVFVLVDRDADDCVQLKRRLEDIAQEASLFTKSAPDQDGRFQVINRIVIEELEAWFLGDENAVKAAYPRVTAFENEAAYRDPDAIPNAAEQLERLLRPHYHKGGLAKKLAAHEIAQHMTPAANRSHSFHAFCAALLEVFA